MDLKEAQLTNYSTPKRHPWELARIDVIKQLLRDYSPFIESRETVILDVGCGDTYLIEELNKSFPKARFLAIDIAFTDEMVKAYNERFQKEKKPIRAYKKLEEADKNLDQVDAVLLLDVLEHVPDDVALLNLIQQHPAVNKNTNFLITVPAFQKLFCAHDVFLDHYRRYNNSLLEKNINKAGLQKIKIGYFFTSLLLPRVVQVVIEKLFKPSSATGIGEWKGGKAKTSLIKSVLDLDFKITYLLQKLGIKLPGLSNYVICRKSVS